MQLDHPAFQPAHLIEHLSGHRVVELNEFGIGQPQGATLTPRAWLAKGR
jgi:hypothetical protein